MQWPVSFPVIVIVIVDYNLVQSLSTAAGFLYNSRLSLYNKTIINFIIVIVAFVLVCFLHVKVVSIDIVNRKITVDDNDDMLKSSLLA